MSSISSTHFNWLPQPSAYSQIQAQREQRASDNSDFLDSASSMASSFGDAMSSQYDGVANLAADAAAKRLGITLPSSTDTTSTDSSSSSTSSSTDSSTSSDGSSSTASPSDYMQTINQIFDGTSDIVSQTQSAVSSAGSAQAAIANMLDGADIGGTQSATENEIVNGTASLENSAPNQISSDGNMFSTIDRIINTTVAPPSVNMTV